MDVMEHQVHKVDQDQLELGEPKADKDQPDVMEMMV